MLEHSVVEVDINPATPIGVKRLFLVSVPCLSHLHLDGNTRTTSVDRDGSVYLSLKEQTIQFSSSTRFK
jgi:hypothetical protein